MNLHENIRKLRELKGYSQQYMAQCLDISQNSFSKIELGKLKLTTERLEEIAEILNLNLIDILEFDEQRILHNSYPPVKDYIHFSLLEKERALYEQRITHLEDEVKFLRNLLSRNLK